MRVIREDDYLAQNGASLLGIGDAGAHKTHSRMSRKQWDRVVREQDRRSAAVVDRREALRQEYREKVAAGELRPPTRRERLEAIAGGMPEKEATQAARRILAAQYGVTFPDSV